MWQGVVLCNTDNMAGQLLEILTKRLLILSEEFWRLDPEELSDLLVPTIEEAVIRECCELWWMTL